MKNCDYCGHPKGEHYGGLGGCDHHDLRPGLGIHNSWFMCSCTRYRKPKQKRTKHTADQERA